MNYRLEFNTKTYIEENIGKTPRDTGLRDVLGKSTPVTRKTKPRTDK